MTKNRFIDTPYLQMIYILLLDLFCAVLFLYIGSTLGKSGQLNSICPQTIANLISSTVNRDIREIEFKTDVCAHHFFGESALKYTSLIPRLESQNIQQKTRTLLPRLRPEDNEIDSKLVSFALDALKRQKLDLQSVRFPFIYFQGLLPLNFYNGLRKEIFSISCNGSKKLDSSFRLYQKLVKLKKKESKFAARGITHHSNKNNPTFLFIKSLKRKSGECYKNFPKKSKNILNLKEKYPLFSELSTMMNTLRFKEALFAKMQVGLARIELENVSVNIRIFNERFGLTSFFAGVPHTDQDCRNCLLTLQLYFPESEVYKYKYGTCFYGFLNLEDNFDTTGVIRCLEYATNSGYVFWVGNRTYHFSPPVCLYEVCEEDRHSIMINFVYDNTIRTLKN